MHLTEMDLVRGGIANAMAEGLSIDDIWACAEHAQDALAFDEAINTLVQAMPLNTGKAFVGGKWMEIK